MSNKPLPKTYRVGQQTNDPNIPLPKVPEPAATVDYVLPNCTLSPRPTSVLEVYGVPVRASTLDKLFTESPSTILENSSEIDEFGYVKQGDHNYPDYTDIEAASIEVIWDSKDDYEDIRQTSSLRKWIIVTVLSIAILQITLSSSVWAQSTKGIQKTFHVNDEIVTLGLTLFMIGMSIGPLFSPWSEICGRRPVYFFAFLVYICLQLLIILGPSFRYLLAGRFFTGLSGATIITTAIGTISDLFAKRAMGAPMVVVLMAYAIGPVLAPVLSSFVSELIGFSWVYRIIIIWSGTMAFIVLTLVPETYGDILLARKAKRLRKQSKNPNFVAPIELERKNNILKLVLHGLWRPLGMLFTDFIIFYLCTYAGLLMGIVYSFFTAFPYVFSKVYNLKPQMQGTPFLAIAIGMLVATATQPLLAYSYRSKNRTTTDFPAGCWLLQIVFSSLFVVGGLCLFGWTNFGRFSMIIPLVGAGLFGFGCLLCLTAIHLHIANVNPRQAVSGIAAVMLVTGILAAIFPLFAGGGIFYTYVGIHWPPTILGILCGLIGVPFPAILAAKLWNS